MLKLTQVGDTACTVLEHSATKGGRYEVLLIESHDIFGATGLYDIVFKTRGKVTGKSCNYPDKESAYASLAKNINTARCVDGINYLSVKTDG